MNRRKLLQLSLLAALPVSDTHSLQAAPAKPASKKTVSGSPKKGLGLGMKSPKWEEKLKGLNCKWSYSWTANFPQRPIREISYVPMVWGTQANETVIATAGKTAKHERTGELLGFNEPDRKDQANMSVQDALSRWPQLEKTRLRLGSPACAHPEGEWMMEFMQAAKTKKLKVDFVCVHSYGGDNVTTFIEKLHKIHQLYEKPIWITEFAVADWQALNHGKNQFSPDAVLKFMEAALPQLDKLDFVERYAWFPAGPGSSQLGTSALFDEQGKLTRLGECYHDA